MILLKMFSGPLYWDFLPSSIPIILKFDLFIVSKCPRCFELVASYVFYFLWLMCHYLLWYHLCSRFSFYLLYSVGDACIYNSWSLSYVFYHQGFTDFWFHICFHSFLVLRLFCPTPSPAWLYFFKEFMCFFFF